MFSSGMQELNSAKNLAQNSEVLSLAEISQRMNLGIDQLHVELRDGEIDCSTLSYLEITYAFVSKEYTASLLISNREKNIVLYTVFEGTPSCDEIKTNPITGIVTKFEPEAIQGMYKTNIMGIRRFQNAQIFRLCGSCTKESKNSDALLSFGLAALFFLGFIFSLYYQWKLWSAEDRQN
jgi:hypothetical protein